MSNKLCGARGPRGLVCIEPVDGHGPRHSSGPVDEPAEDCDVCEAKAGQHCADPRSCETKRWLIARVP